MPAPYPSSRWSLFLRSADPPPVNCILLPKLAGIDGSTGIVACKPGPVYPIGEPGDARFANCIGALLTVPPNPILALPDAILLGVIVPNCPLNSPTGVDVTLLLTRSVPVDIGVVTGAAFAAALPAQLPVDIP